MTWSAPIALALAAFSSSPTVVITVAPMYFASLIAAEPMPEPPACTSTISPGCSFALSNSMCTAVAKVSGAQEASVGEMLFGAGTTSRAG